jgi:hypothetical protein
MVVVLIFYLTIMGIQLSYSEKKGAIIKRQACPDHWSSIIHSDKQHWCVFSDKNSGRFKDNNNNNIANPSCIGSVYGTSDLSLCTQPDIDTNKVHPTKTAINFNHNFWLEKAGQEGITLKEQLKKWANINGISWNTVTNS